MKKVRFENGLYGIRTHWWFGWYFLDLKSPPHTWQRESMFFSDCMGSEEEVDKNLSKPKSYKPKPQKIKYRVIR